MNKLIPSLLLLTSLAALCASRPPNGAAFGLLPQQEMDVINKDKKQPADDPEAQAKAEAARQAEERRQKEEREREERLRREAEERAAFRKKLGVLAVILAAGGFLVFKSRS